MAVIEAPVNTREAWSSRAVECDDSWDACGWSYEGQTDRHEAVVEALAPSSGESLLDWGCGTGDLVDILARDVVYCGFDTADGMVARAGRAHQSRRFTTHEPYGHFDLVACVGPFNLPDGWSKQHTWWTLRHLWETKTPRALAASLYAGDDENCLRYSERETTVAALMLGGSAVAITRVRNDLLLVVRR